MKTTNKDFGDYKKWCNFYIQKFGLTDYQIFFNHSDLGRANANVSIDIESRIANFGLNTFIRKLDRVNRTWKFFARHETCHLLVSDVSNLVGEYCSKEEHYKQDEALVVRLTDLLDDTK